MTPKSHLAGTHRAISPRQTIDLARPHLESLGITRVANVTGLDCLGIPTVMVTRPNSRSLSVTQGKGLDLEAARASGIMEAIEQAHAEQIDAPLRLASVDDLRGRVSLVDVAGLPRFVRPFTDGARILWIEARDLASDEPTWVPFELVHLDFRLPLPEGSGFFLAGSNGLASGNNLLEAVSHGICEVIERDATTLFRALPARQRRARRIDLATIDDTQCRGLLDLYQRAEVDVALWDVSSDVGVACVACSVLESWHDPFRPVGLARGVGCHPDRAVAVSRALTEAAQSRLTRIVGSRDDFRTRDVEALRCEDSFARHHAELDLDSAPQRQFQDLPTFTAQTFEEDVAWLGARLRAAGDGHQVLVVDLSRARYPFAVVRVIVPGLEGLSDVPGYQPGPRACAAAGSVAA